MNKHLNCEKCGSETKTKLVDKNIFHKGQVYLIENIEAEICHDCGERYFNANVLLEIESQIENGKYRKAA
jgi:YgiT-type zinc finger domain-containing protein